MDIIIYLLCLVSASIEEPRLVSDVLSQSVIYTPQAAVVVRHQEYRADPIGAYQCDLALLLEACDDRAFDNLASSLQQMKTSVGAE